MQTRSRLDPLESKTWQLDFTNTGIEGYLYYCELCDEALALSKNQLNPQKIQLAFNNACPGCSFELDRVLNCKSSLLPHGRTLLTSLKCEAPDMLSETNLQSEPQLRRGNSLPRDPNPGLTTGIEDVDETLVLKRGQLVYLQGERSHPFSLLLCARATLPAPYGLDSNVIFIDAGNLYDTYTIAEHSVNNGSDSAQVNPRIHLSRAFTHHQVYTLITRTLPHALEEYNSSLAIVSDITALFCDPDVRNNKESLDIFRKSVQSLSRTAEDRSALILATNQKARKKEMEGYLTKIAQVSSVLKDGDKFPTFKVSRHPFIHERDNHASLEHHC